MLWVSWVRKVGRIAGSERLQRIGQLEEVKSTRIGETVGSQE